MKEKMKKKFLFRFLIMALLLLAALAGCGAKSAQMTEQANAEDTEAEAAIQKESGSDSDGSPLKNHAGAMGSLAAEENTEDEKTAPAENSGDDGTETGSRHDAQAEDAALEDSGLLHPEGMNILERFSPPAGYERVQADGFGTFLRNYPLLTDGSPVLLYDGFRKGNQSAHIAVFDMALVDGDLQQCADSCIRLYAEYFYQNGQYDKLAFHLTNGFLVDFDTWRKGGRVSVKGNHTEWVMKASPSDSEETFEAYLRFVFNYAGTLSMESEARQIEIKDMRAGDVFLRGASPGHVVMVLDVCENAQGEKAFLLGQGYMPAQQFHVLKNPASLDDPWYYENDISYPFSTPEYVFEEGSFKRMQYLAK